MLRDTLRVSPQINADEGGRYDKIQRMPHMTEKIAIQLDEQNKIPETFQEKQKGNSLDVAEKEGSENQPVAEKGKKCSTILRHILGRDDIFINIWIYKADIDSVSKLSC